MIVRVRDAARRPVPPRAEQPPVRRPQVRQDERCGRHRGVQELGVAEGRPRLRERLDRHRVPAGEHLVVGRRAHAPLPRLEQDPPGLLEVRPRRRRRPAGRHRTFVRSLAQFPSGSAPNASAASAPDEPDELVPGPREELPLHPFGVGVLAREEAAVGMPHLAEQVAEGLGGDPPVALVPGHDPGARVQLGQLGVVVEHLLEVGHQPGRVGRVAGEAAAELVVDAPGGHAVERRGEHRQRVGRVAQRHPQHELERHRLRELRRATEASPRRVERSTQLAPSPAT